MHAIITGVMLVVLMPMAVSTGGPKPPLAHKNSVQGSAPGLGFLLWQELRNAAAAKGIAVER